MQQCWKCSWMAARHQDLQNRLASSTYMFHQRLARAGGGSPVAASSAATSGVNRFRATTPEGAKPFEKGTPASLARFLFWAWGRSGLATFVASAVVKHAMPGRWRTAWPAPGWTRLHCGGIIMRLAKGRRAEPECPHQACMGGRMIRRGPTRRDYGPKAGVETGPAPDSQRMIQGRTT